MSKHAKITLESFKVLKLKPGKTKSGDDFFSMELVGESDRLRAFAFENSLAFMGMKASTEGKASPSLIFKEGGVYDFDCEGSFESQTVNGKFIQCLKTLKIKSYTSAKKAPTKNEGKTEVRPIVNVGGFGKEAS